MTDEPLKQPHSTIGVQDLITLNKFNCCGFLRKRGRLERIADSVKIVKPLLPSIAKWRQKFVVLSRGCIYIFVDEFSSSPTQAYSLNVYHRVARHNASDGRERWSFEIIPEDTTANKLLIFGCATEEDRKSWMYAVKEQMLTFNSIKSRQPTIDEKGDYLYLEKPVREQKPNPPPPPTSTAPKNEQVQKKSKPPTPSDDSDEITSDDDSSGDEYDEIPEDLPIPPEENDIKKKKAEVKNKPVKAQKPIKAPKPKPVLKTQLSRRDFEFSGSDRQQVELMLKSKGVGTFLVRKSRQDDREVLSVLTDEGVKEYKIYNDPMEGFSLDNQIHFNNVEKLVEHYMKNSLPNRTMSLSRGYSSPDR